MRVRGAGKTSDERVSRILQTGDPDAAEELLPLLYDELRRLAHQRLRQEPSGNTLQTTALVHEAYLRLVGNEDVRWENRGHFFGAAARAMRRILIDRARKRRTPKHGGDRARLRLSEIDLPSESEMPPDRLLALNEALDRLERFDARKAQIVMLRFFAGLTIDDVAHALGLSRTTVKDEWQFARAWLHNEMTRD